MDVIGRMRRLIDAQTYGPPDDDGEIVGPFRKTWVLALLDVAEAAGSPDEYPDTAEGFGEWLTSLRGALARLDALTEER